jgi:hypothetical protein
MFLAPEPFRLLSAQLCSSSNGTKGVNVLHKIPFKTGQGAVVEFGGAPGSYKQLFGETDDFLLVTYKVMGVIHSASYPQDSYIFLGFSGPHAGLNILSAKYYHGKVEDAPEQVEKLLLHFNGSRLEIGGKSGHYNSIFGDPAKFVSKRLQIVYLLNGFSYVHNSNEDDKVVIG